MERIANSRMLNVWTLTPPAVEPAEPPTNIRPIMTNRPSSVIAPMSTELKPAVRPVAWKNALSTRGPSAIAPRVAGFARSVNSKRQVPMTGEQA